MSTYTSVTDVDLRVMLETIGVGSVQELFDRQIPASVRLSESPENNFGFFPAFLCS